ncbi:MAG: dihydropteroate synthase [Saprospiraceae bacterium]|jgi:dihydropteroate synthase
MNSINCNGKLVDLSLPIVMGILNVTPDSFYDGGKHNSIADSLVKVEQMIADGATIIDIGGMSSRPGAEIISLEEELSRVLPVIKLIVKKYPNQVLSIDTVHGVVAKAAIDAGVCMINDISAASIDSSIIQVAMDEKVPYVLMHMQGKPADMQESPTYENVVMDVLSFLKEKVYKLRNMGMIDIIIDPGFGFGKNIKQNYQLLRKMSVFRILDCPIIVGLSRKSMIYRTLDVAPEESLNGTTALHMVALQNGAKILRVHDVKEASQAIKLFSLVE